MFSKILLGKTLAGIPLVFIMPLCWQGEAMAEIYKYKDEHGQWKFTDKPPEHLKQKHSITYSAKNKKSGKLSDYQKILQDKYKPKSPIESATLAVVTVETSMGSGSGFFISDQCYLITNKHVVRPTATDNWQKSKEELEAEKAKVKEIKRLIAEEKERLEIEKKNLEDFRKNLDTLGPGTLKNDKEAEYQFYLRRYHKDSEILDEKTREAKNRKKEYDKKRYSFSVNSSLATLSRSFKITLKDNTKTQAKLIKLAKDADLALLKIDYCKSPYLKLDKSVQPYQGMNIFAIGSPLGLKDHVTAGIVTNVTDGDINTDAQVLPGNSGGPLVTPKGEVIGVNTLKVSAESSHAEGFGIAIPVNVIVQNFGNYIQ